MKTATTDPFAVDETPAPAESIAPGETNEPVEDNADEKYDFVRLPNGQVHAVLKSSVHEAPATDVQNIPANSLVEVAEQQYYVHLSDGSVVRVKNSDLPIRSNGTNAVYGHWQRENKVYEVIGVYPVEDIVEGQ